MSFKLEVSVGGVSLRFEGDEEPFDKYASAYVKKIIEGAVIAPPDTSNPFQKERVEGQQTEKPLRMTSKAVATKLGVDGGGGLLYAAIAKLGVVDQQETFTRSDINSEMKSATGFYKPSFSSNLSNYLDTLEKRGVLIETSRDTFAITHTEQEEMRAKLL